MSTVPAQIEEFLSCKWQSVLAWRCLLGRLASLSSRLRGLSSDAISSTPSSGTVEFYGRRRVRLLNFNDPMRPQVVVRQASPAVRSAASCVSAGSSLLVRCIGSGLGCTPPRSLCLGPLVSGEESFLHQSGLHHF